MVDNLELTLPPNAPNFRSGVICTPAHSPRRRRRRCLLVADDKARRFLQRFFCLFFDSLHQFLARWYIVD